MSSAVDLAFRRSLETVGIVADPGDVFLEAAGGNVWKSNSPKSSANDTFGLFDYPQRSVASKPLRTAGLDCHLWPMQFHRRPLWHSSFWEFIT